MDFCVFCNAGLGDNTVPEHILLQSMGGRKTTGKVVCNACNNDFGSGIDKALAKSVEPIRNIGNFKSGNRRPPPIIRNIEAGSDIFDLLPGAVPAPQINKKIIINSLADGGTELAIQARDREEFVLLVDAAAAKLKLSGAQAEKFRAEALTSATLQSRPAPSVGLQTSYGDTDSQRSMAKACLVLWADSVGTAEVRLPRYDVIRSFIRGKDGSDIGQAFISIDARPLPPFGDKFGSNPNVVWVGSNYDGRVIGYFRLYGAIGWSIELSEGGAPANRSFCLISNPEAPSIWSDASNEASVVNFGWAAEKQDTSDFEAVKTSFGKLLENAHERSVKGLISDVIADAIDETGMVMGEVPSKEQWDQFSRVTAWKLCHALMKLPYTIPVKLNKKSD